MNGFEKIWDSSIQAGRQHIEKTFAEMVHHGKL